MADILRDRREQWKAANRDKMRGYRRAYYQRNKAEILLREKQDRASSRERCRKWKAANPQKVKAGSLARAASYFESCELCGEVHSLEKHHPDYTEPLITVTLCRTCHKAVHVQLLRELIKNGT